MTKDTKAVIFDFDMTLADSSYAIHHCSNLLARKFGLEEVSREVVLAGIGLPIEDCWRLYWGDFKEEWLGYYRDEFRRADRHPPVPEHRRGARRAPRERGKDGRRLQPALRPPCR